MTVLAAVATCILALSACASDDASVSTGPAGTGQGPGATVYRFTGTILQSPAHGPELCANVAESYPPQCGGIPVVGLDWALVDGVTTAGGTTWAEATVVGTYDGATFTLSEPPRAPELRSGRKLDFSTPCPDPAGGWRPPPAALDTEAALTYARAQDGFAGAWVDQRRPAGDPELSAPTHYVLNVAFTGDLDRHRAELGQRWSGALCVVEARRTLAELRAVQQALVAGEVPELGQVLSAGVLEHIQTVQASVWVTDDRARAAVEERFGAGAVELTGVLEAVATG